MDSLDMVLDARLAEIQAYLDLLTALEGQVRKGTPRIGEDGPVISAIQQRMLYSSVYLQLYNLVEATVNKCVEAVCSAMTQWGVADLSVELRREWVRFAAKTHRDLNCENRLRASFDMCERLLAASPVGDIELAKGGGGNWDDEEIHRFTARLGCRLSLSDEVNVAVKSRSFNDDGPLKRIVKLRNQLAHGNVSFGECGADVTVSDLRLLTKNTAEYLRDVVTSFKAFIGGHEFLKPGRRPAEVCA